MNIVVVGSGGYVGRGLCLALEQRGHVVRRFDKRIYNQSLHPETIEGGAETIRRYFEFNPGERVDSVINVAAYAHDTAGRVPAGAMLENNALEPDAVLEQALKWGARRYVVTSSLSVFGEGAYAHSKRIMERHLRQRAPLVVDLVRFGTLYGISGYGAPEDELTTFRGHLLLNSMLLSGIRDGRIVAAGPQNLRPVLSLYAAIDILVQLATDERRMPGEIHNHCHASANVLEYARMVATYLSLPESAIEVRPGVDSRSYGWETEHHGINTYGVFKTIAWLRQYGHLVKTDQLDQLYKKLGV